MCITRKSLLQALTFISILTMLLYCRLEEVRRGAWQMFPTVPAMERFTRYC